MGRHSARGSRGDGEAASSKSSCSGDGRRLEVRWRNGDVQGMEEHDEHKKRQDHVSEVRENKEKRLVQ
jgi:hypothetical protein